MASRSVRIHPGQRGRLRDRRAHGDAQLAHDRVVGGRGAQQAGRLHVGAAADHGHPGLRRVLPADVVRHQLGLHERAAVVEDTQTSHPRTTAASTALAATRRGRRDRRPVPYRVCEVGHHAHSRIDRMLRLMHVHAHPDDESSKGAASTAKYVAEGVDVHVATCTGGERGSILNPKMDRPDVLENIAEIRRQEMERGPRDPRRAPGLARLRRLRLARGRPASRRCRRAASRWSRSRRRPSRWCG